MRQYVSVLITAILLGLCLLPALAAAQTTPQATPPQEGATQQLQATLDSILSVLLDPRLREDQHKTQRMGKVSHLFRQRFAERIFCERALGRYWKERTAPEQEEFILLFATLLVDTYLERIDSYLTGNTNFSHKNITYLGERSAKAYTLVTTDVQLDQTKTIPVLYRMEKVDGDWKVTDIALEGISLLKNYRAQFNEIIANAGYDELLKRLQAKQV
jgi:phospholipid transport system substrate-binding protein